MSYFWLVLYENVPWRSWHVLDTRSVRIHSREVKHIIQIGKCKLNIFNTTTTSRTAVDTVNPSAEKLGYHYKLSPPHKTTLIELVIIKI